MSRLLAALREAGSDWFSHDAPNLVFAFKTSAAGLLALWISFRLDFSQPQWALMTVFIVARKESGLVMTKSFYRVLGTMVGCSVALILAAVFSQTPELFLLTLASWIGVCVALAARYRNFQSYGFMLAGYTAAIVGFGAAMDANHAFDIAQSRVSEVVLGIICAGVMAEAVFPRHAATRLVPEANARFARFADFLEHAFSLKIDSKQMFEVQQYFLSDLVASETQRSSTFLESPDSRLRDARLRWMNASFMKISSTMHGFIQSMARLRLHVPEEAVSVVTEKYRDLMDCFKSVDGTRDPVVIAERIAAYRVRLQQHRAESFAQIAKRSDDYYSREISGALSLYMRVVDELFDYVTAVAGLSHENAPVPDTVPAFTLHADRWIATLSGVRATAVLFILSTFWIAAAWPGGSGAAILGTVFCILFGSAPAPVSVVKKVAIGFGVGQILAFACLFWILPNTDGFEMMALAMLPFLFFSAWLIEHPRYSVEGTGVFLSMLAALAPHNQMHYDIVSFLNEGIATFIGLGAAGVAFSISPASAVRLRARLLAGLGQQAAQACSAPLGNGALRHRFESRTRDLMYQLSTPPASSVGGLDDSIEHAWSILEVGQIVLEARIWMEQLKNIVDVQKPVACALSAISALCVHPSESNRQIVITALEDLEVELDALQDLTMRDSQIRDELQLCRYQIRSILRDDEWFQLVHKASNPPDYHFGVAHAA